MPITIQALVALFVIPAAIFDLRWRRVPNWLTLAGLLLGVAANFLHYRTDGFRLSSEGLGLALLIYAPLYLLRAMGAGDVKLMAALGAIVGPHTWLEIFLLTAVIGGAAALFLIITRGRFRKTLRNLLQVIKSARSGKAPFAENPELDVRTGEGLHLPHAVMVACGALGFLLAGALRHS